MDGPLIVDQTRLHHGDIVAGVGIQGLLTHDDGCLLLDDGPVVWADNVTWEPATGTVSADDGSSIRVGERLRAGGNRVLRAQVDQLDWLDTDAGIELLRCLGHTAGGVTLLSHGEEFRRDDRSPRVVRNQRLPRS